MSQSSQRYANPPLREAACEFRFQPGPEPWNLSYPGLIYSELREEFPRLVQTDAARQEFSTAFSNAFGNLPERLGRSGPAVQPQSLSFWREEDEYGAITVSPDRLSISHYRPYPSWDAFLGVIRQAYGSYVNVAKPQTLQRIGLRFLNEIQFHTDAIALSDYFTYYPSFGPQLPQFNVNVKMSVDFEFDNYRDLARLQLATISGADGPSIAVSLDIDYFLRIPGAVPLTDTEDWLDKGHSRISTIFEGSITDRTRAILKTKGEG